MHLRVLFFAALRDRAGTSELTLSLPAPLTVAELTTAIAGEHAHLGEALGSSGVRVAVNEEFVDGDHRLADGDEVAFLPPVSGG